MSERLIKKIVLSMFVIFFITGCQYMSQKNQKMNLPEAFKKYIESLESIPNLNNVCLNAETELDELNLLKNYFQLNDDSEVLELYKLSNGQVGAENGCAMLFVNGYSFSPINVVIFQADSMRKLSNEEPDLIFWEKSYIPIAEDGAGNYLIFDAKDRISSPKWRVFGYENEVENFPLNSSLAELFESYIELIQNKDYRTLDGDIFVLE